MAYNQPKKKKSHLKTPQIPEVEHGITYKVLDLPKYSNCIIRLVITRESTWSDLIPETAATLLHRLGLLFARNNMHTEGDCGASGVETEGSSIYQNVLFDVENMQHNY